MEWRKWHLKNKLYVLRLASNSGDKRSIRPANPPPQAANGKQNTETGTMVALLGAIGKLPWGGIDDGIRSNSEVILVMIDGELKLLAKGREYL